MAYSIVVPVTSAVKLPVLAALVAAETPLSVNDLHRITHAQPNSIQLRMKWLEQSGAVKVTDTNPRRFILVDTDQLRRKATQRDRIWRAIRVQRSFSLPDLMMTASASRRSAETFINDLLRAGYLRLIKRGNPVNGDWSHYHLVVRSGPKTPKTVKRKGAAAKQLIDPNTGAEIDISPNPPELRGKHHARY